MKNTTVRTNYEKEFLDRFNTLCRSRNSWQVWSDVITTMACALANSVNKENSDFQKREDEYKECIERLGGVQVPSEMFALMTMALDENPEQDFLGSMFMKLELGSHWKGQFFTPYNICKLMAEINCEELATQIEEKGWVSVNDCACGYTKRTIPQPNLKTSQAETEQTIAVHIPSPITHTPIPRIFAKVVDVE